MEALNVAAGRSLPDNLQAVGVVSSVYAVYTKYVLCGD